MGIRVRDNMFNGSRLMKHRKCRGRRRTIFPRIGRAIFPRRDRAIFLTRRRDILQGGDDPCCS